MKTPAKARVKYFRDAKLVLKVCCTNKQNGMLNGTINSTKLLDP